MPRTEYLRTTPATAIAAGTRTWEISPVTMRSRRHSSGSEIERLRSTAISELLDSVRSDYLAATGLGRVRHGIRNRMVRAASSDVASVTVVRLTMPLLIGAPSPGQSRAQKKRRSPVVSQEAEGRKGQRGTAGIRGTERPVSDRFRRSAEELQRRPPSRKRRHTQNIVGLFKRPPIGFFVPSEVSMDWPRFRPHR